MRRLRRHRERQQLTLDDLTRMTRVRKDLFEALERGDLDAWPKGLYSRAWIRVYAEAVGLDPVETVDEFCRLFPQADRRAQATLNELAAILDVPDLRLDEPAEPGPNYGRRATDRPVQSPQSFRDRLAQAARSVTRARRLREILARLAASWRTLRPSRPTP